MVFGRRKSNIFLEPAQDETDSRRRNRLSKPPITPIKITSVSTVSLQAVEANKEDGSTTDEALSEPPAALLSDEALRWQIRSQIFEQADGEAQLSAIKNGSTLSVSNIVNHINKMAAAGETSPNGPRSPSKVVKRKSLLIRRRSSRQSTIASRNASTEHFTPLNSDQIPSASANTSVDRFTESPAFPPSRRASFTPGAATRKPSAVQLEEAMREKNTIEEAEEHIINRDDGGEEPQPPLRIVVRVGTPSSLNYTHLGGLRLGSLQVVNGRASPAPSELSKHLLIPRQTRDVSSDYGDVDGDREEGFDQSMSPEEMSPLQGASSLHRDFSWKSRDDRCSLVEPRNNHAATHLQPQIRLEADQTSILAKEYMAELPESPFKERGLASVCGTLRRSKSEGSLWESPSVSSQRSPSPASTVDNRRSSISSPGSRPVSPTGSVIHNFQDEALNDRSEDVTDAGHNRLESAASWYSPTEPRLPCDEAFQSALEFQVQQSVERLRPPLPAEKSDSGYSSGNSLRSFQMKAVTSREEMAAVTETSTSAVDVLSYQPRERPADLPSNRRSILKSRKTEPALPTFANLRAPVISLSSAPIPITEPPIKIKPGKTRNKLQKRRPIRTPRAKSPIGDVHAVDRESLPVIPVDVRENLRIRSQEVPELEKTFNSPYHMSTQASISTLRLQSHEIRFPSPSPDEPAHTRRSWSQNRRRSWLGRSKENDAVAKHNSDVNQADTLAVIRDFGTTAASLGSNPYDLANQRIWSNQMTSAHSVSSRRPRPRSMMDEQTATELARRRSRSIQERDMYDGRRTSFNDRGGIPGKSFRPSSFVGGAPPITPEMLQRAFGATAEHEDAGFSSSPPPPPPHSPRPAYIEYHEDYSNMAIAPPPPPPAHSPAPRDISLNQWTTHAAIWKARRQSACAALERQTWDAAQIEVEQEYVLEEPLYPVIPPRKSVRSQQERSGRVRHNFSENEGYRYDDESHCSNYARDSIDSYAREAESYHQAGAQSYHDSQDYCLRNTQPHFRGRSTEQSDNLHQRPLPSPSSGQPQYVTPRSRPRSRAGSIRSHASSLAEELHPPDLERKLPAPEFGRYSGGLNYEYERDRGFGGSAGTRSVSGKADAPRVGVKLRSSFGVDLGDVPVIRSMGIRGE